LLLGLARLRNMRGASLLSETYAHENHFGFKEAKHLLERLKPIIGLNLKLENLEKEIQFVDEQEKLFSQSNKAVRKAFKQAYDKLDLKYIG
jgi:proteasome assembly chaperone (PAC2) family protein